MIYWLENIHQIKLIVFFFHFLIYFMIFWLSSFIMMYIIFIESMKKHYTISVEEEAKFIIIFVTGFTSHKWTRWMKNNFSVNIHLITFRKHFETDNLLLNENTQRESAGERDHKLEKGKFKQKKKLFFSWLFIRNSHPWRLLLFCY